MSSVNQTKQLNKAQIAELEKAQSFLQIVWNQFKHNAAAVIGMYVIIFYAVIAILAPLIGNSLGVDSDTQNVFNRYAPPFSYSDTAIDVREAAIKAYADEYSVEAEMVQKALIKEEFVSTTNPEDALYEWAKFDRYKAQAAIRLLNVDQDIKDDFRAIARKFESFNVFGTDELGRDVLMRLIYGTRVSLGVAVMVALVSSLIGLLVGTLAGYYGGLVDTLLMRITDALLSLPLMPILIIIAAIDLQKLPFLGGLISSGNESILKVIFVLCIFSWMTIARLVRGSVLTLREREYILAAKTLGARDTTIMIRHMLPHVIAPLLVSVTLGVGESILFEAALSFLGLGIQPPTPSWGNMLFNAQELIYQAPFLAILPGLMILFVTISFNYVGDGLQDAIDPKTIKR